jgi:hypothetical protein
VKKPSGPRIVEGQSSALPSKLIIIGCNYSSSSLDHPLWLLGGQSHRRWARTSWDRCMRRCQSYMTVVMAGRIWSRHMNNSGVDYRHKPPLVEKRLSPTHQNCLSPTHFGSPATYMPAVMLTAGECYSSPRIKNIADSFGMCTGIIFYPWQTSNRCARDKISKNPKKISKKKKSKIFYNCKNLNNTKNCAYMIFLTILSHLKSPQFTPKRQLPTRSPILKMLQA